MSLNFSSTSDGLLDYSCPTVSYYLYSAVFTLRMMCSLPLSIFVLYLGHQKWKQQRSFKTASHSDIFTYHMAVMELIGVLGFIVYIYGLNTNQLTVQGTAQLVSYIPFFGGTFFQALTCVERYLAVVHPVTYRGLRSARGVMIRNISTGCAWLFCFGLITLYSTMPNGSEAIVSCFLALLIVIITFCSFSVLRALTHPGPGEAGVEKERVDQLKLKAFHTITAITVVVWLWFSVVIVSSVLTPLLSKTARCMLGPCISIVNLPCSFVLPFLYLQREGKLSHCFCNCK